MRQSQLERVLRLGIRAIIHEEKNGVMEYSSTAKKYIKRDTYSREIRATMLLSYVIGYTRGDGTISDELRDFLNLGEVTTGPFF